MESGDKGAALLIPPQSRIMHLRCCCTRGSVSLTTPSFPAHPLLPSHRLLQPCSAWLAALQPGHRRPLEAPRPCPRPRSPCVSLPPSALTYPFPYHTPPERLTDLPLWHIPSPAPALLPTPENAPTPPKKTVHLALLSFVGLKAQEQRRSFVPVDRKLVSAVVVGLGALLSVEGVWLNGYLGRYEMDGKRKRL